jgi:hypothetical protein
VGRRSVDGACLDLSLGGAVKTVVFDSLRALTPTSAEHSRLHREASCGSSPEAWSADRKPSAGMSLKSYSAREAVSVGAVSWAYPEEARAVARSASTVAAAARTVLSDPISPSRVRPTGSPLVPVPADTEMAGVPATAAAVAFATRVLRTSALRPLWKKVVSSPIIGAVVVTVGYIRPWIVFSAKIPR